MKSSAAFAFYSFGKRFLAVALFHWRRLWCFPTKTEMTFCIAHFNGADFLEVTLHAIRRHYPDGRIVVADSQSVWQQYVAAQMVCKKFSAELHPLLFKHSHTALLNYLFRQIRSEIGVFLDQDCVLLQSLNLLFEKVTETILLAGPRDELKVCHPNLLQRYTYIHDHQLFRDQPNFIHASLMVVNAGKLQLWAGRHPFEWQSNENSPAERYYGLTERIRQKTPDAILWLDSQHTGYGVGAVYFYNGHSLAYHNWFSGRVFGQNGKMDWELDAEWLRNEKSRFIQDYWAGTVKLDLQ
jgi:hypothetical protein